MSNFIYDLPEVRGSYRFNVDISKTCWFRVGGNIDVIFRPEDEEDLKYFLENKPNNIPFIVMGVGSNLLIPDESYRGIFIRLGRKFSEAKIIDGLLHAGSGALDFNVAQFALNNSISGLEFLVGIPGTIGGAIAMNAGCYGREFSDIVEYIEAFDESGNFLKISAKDCGFIYRDNTLPENLIFTKAVLKGEIKDQKLIKEKMEDISFKRNSTQPVKARTCGSTFINPTGYTKHKVWELIDAVGGRGLKIGGAQISELHCNFIVNTGDATAKDILDLGEEIRRRVKEKFNIELEWEIKRL